jgi:hypothetical protein
VATEQGRVLTLTAPAPSIRRVLTATGLDDLLDRRTCAGG